MLNGLGVGTQLKLGNSGKQVTNNGARGRTFVLLHLECKQFLNAFEGNTTATRGKSVVIGSFCISGASA